MTPGKKRKDAPSLSPSDYAEILNGVGDGVYVTDHERTIIYWNKGCEEITGYDAGRAVGTHCYSNLLVHVDETGRELCHGGCPMAATLDDGVPRQAEVFLRHRQGHRLPVRVQTRPLRYPSGEIWGAVETFGPISGEMAALEQIRELESRVYVDTLTGIANRSFMQEHLATRSAEAERYGWGLGLIMMDIDHFKTVNDTYGHEAGDLVLQTVARTLREATRSFDAVGRWGGEEFLAVVMNIDVQTLQRIAERYRVLVRESRPAVAGRVLHVTISAGVAVAARGDLPAQVLARADNALYESKRLGRDRVTAA